MYSAGGRSLVVLALAGAWLACPGEPQAPATATGYEALSSDAEPLRSRFNADAGKVRVLMLAAPT